jgi:hypothetical protein
MDTATRAASAPAAAALAAWGAGLVQIALGAGALTATVVAQEDGAARGAGAVLVAFGAATLAWGVAVLARGRILAPRAGIGGALTGLLATTVMLWLAPGGTSVAAVAAAAVLLVVVGFLCGHRLRTSRTHGQDAADSPRISVWAVIGAAVVVGAIVTPALGTTEAARFAPDHGTHELVDPGHH